jgi:hypothetical protein
MLQQEHQFQDHLRITDSSSLCTVSLNLMHYVQSSNPEPYYIPNRSHAGPLAVQFSESLMVLLELTVTMTLDLHMAV